MIRQDVFTAPDWRAALRERHVLIFPEPCLLSCGRGWSVILDELCTAWQWCTENRLAPQLVALEIKQKFGELRVYHRAVRNKATDPGDCPVRIDHHEHRASISLSPGSEAQGALLAFATALSLRTCEFCGAPSRAREDKGGWIATRCDRHITQRLID